MKTPLAGVDIVHWNPRRNTLPLLNWIEIGHRVANFGDLLGVLVAERLRATAPVSAAHTSPASRRPRLLTVGSIMHFAKDGDIVWGSGVNGKIPLKDHKARHLDIRAVRGPLTREWLWSNLRVESPAIFGDPALLLPALMPELAEWSRTKTRSLAVVPNLHDMSRVAGHPHYVSPRGPLQFVLRQIAQSEAVICSSLHGLIVAESLGIPATLVKTSIEPEFKYLDYARGTGRHAVHAVDTFADAERIVVGRSAPRLEWDGAELTRVFPHDLWER